MVTISNTGNSAFYDVVLIDYDASQDLSVLAIDDSQNNRRLLTLMFIPTDVDTVAETFVGKLAVINVCDIPDADALAAAALKAVYHEFNENDETIADVFTRCDTVAFYPVR